MPTTLQPVVSTSLLLDSAAQLDALLHGVAIAPLDDIGWIRVTGDDRVRWLNGMVTNSIQDLALSQGCYNFVLNPQGRIQGDFTAFLLEDRILLQSSRDQLVNLLSTLDRYIIMDDVELADISDERQGILIAGPSALRTVQELGGSPCSALAPAAQLPTTISLKRTTYRGASVDLIQAYSPLVPRFEVWADQGSIADISAELASLPKVPAQALEELRLLEGTPRYGTDIRNSDTARDLPQETAPIGVQHRALHFSKGCYLGQEIVERIHSRGNVHRTFTGFEITGSLPAPGTVLENDGKAVGELTSVTTISLPTPVQLAVGYIRRDVLERGLALTYHGGLARPIALPYSRP